MRFWEWAWVLGSGVGESGVTGDAGRGTPSDEGRGCGGGWGYGGRGTGTVYVGASVYAPTTLKSPPPGSTPIGPDPNFALRASTFSIYPYQPDVVEVGGVGFPIHVFVERVIAEPERVRSGREAHPKSIAVSPVVPHLITSLRHDDDAFFRPRS